MITLDPQLKWLMRKELSTLNRLGEAGRYGLCGSGEEPEVRVLVLHNGQASDIEGLGFRVQAEAPPVLTGTVSLARLRALQPSPYIQYVEAARGMPPDLDLSVPSTGAHLMHASRPRVRGRGAIIGIVDTGIDFTLQAFRRRDGSSRILALWDQGLEPRREERSPRPFSYGVEYRQADLDRALASTDPHARVRHRDRDTARGHGTHVAGIAAGRTHACVGMAPEADLVVVALEHGAGGLRDTAAALDAVAYVFTLAEELGRPAVVNLSHGDHVGPHDGKSLLETGIDSLLRSPGRVVVTSAGNSTGRGGHASGRVPPAGELRLRLRVPPADDVAEQLDLWYEPEDRFAVRLVSPRGEASPWVTAGRSDAEADLPNGNSVYVDSVINHPLNGANRVAIFLGPGEEPAIEPGEWTLVVRGDRAARGALHVWLQQLPGGTAGFLARDSDDSTTVSIPGTSRRVITVGSYVTRSLPEAEGESEVGRLSSASGLGPTRDGRLKPEIAAPGEWIASFRESDAEVSFPLGDGQRHLLSGTSLAAPHVSGAVALLLSRNRGANQAEIRGALAYAGLEDAATGPVPNNAWGAGKLNVDGACAWLRGCRKGKKRGTRKGRRSPRRADSKR